MIQPIKKDWSRKCLYFRKIKTNRVLPLQGRSLKTIMLGKNMKIPYGLDVYAEFYTM